MRIAAVPIKAVCHEALVRAVGVFDAEGEIAVYGEAEAYDHADHPNREEQGLILERPMRCEDRVQERQAEPAAKKRQTHALERVEISLLHIRNLQDSWRILAERSF